MQNKLNLAWLFWWMRRTQASRRRWWRHCFPQPLQIINESFYVVNRLTRPHSHKVSPKMNHQTDTPSLDNTWRKYWPQPHWWRINIRITCERESTYRIPIMKIIIKPIFFRNGSWSFKIVEQGNNKIYTFKTMLKGLITIKMNTIWSQRFESFRSQTASNRGWQNQKVMMNIATLKQKLKAIPK